MSTATATPARNASCIGSSYRLRQRRRTPTRPSISTTQMMKCTVEPAASTTVLGSAFCL